MKRIRIVPVAAAATLLIGAAAPAMANRDYSSCTVDGHVNNASVEYTLTNTAHNWTKIYGKLSGSGTGGKSNFNSRIYANDALKWSWNSGDTWGQNEQYAKQIGVSTLRSQYEKVRMITIFDEFGPDDTCTVSWNY